MSQEKVLGNAVNVGLDIGASSVKASYYLKENVIKDFSFFNRVDTNVDTGDGTTVEVENEVLKVGSIGGVSNSNPKKTNYKNLKHILFKVSQELKKSLEIKGDIVLNINTCLPPKQFQTNKEEYKERLKEVDGVQGSVEGEVFRVLIEDVKCGAEGIMLLKSFDLDSVASDLLKVMLIDVGSSTADIILLERCGDSWKIKMATTSEQAGASMCQDIEKYLNGKGKANYDWQDLERLGKYQEDGEVKDITSQADAADATVKGLLSDIDKVGTFTEYKPVLAGQGSKILSKNKLFKEVTGGFILVDETNQKFGNSRGCLKAFTS